MAFDMGGAVSGAALGTKILPGWGTAIGAVGGGIFGGLSGGDEEEYRPLFNLPDFKRDPLFDLTQENLYNISTAGLFGGAVPSPFFESIGRISESGALAGVIQQGANLATKKATEAAVARGRTGGAIDTAIAGAVGAFAPKLTFEALLKDIESRKGLLDLWMGTQESVRGGALDITKLETAFNLERADLELRGQGVELETAAEEGGFFDKLLKGGSALGTTISEILENINLGRGGFLPIGQGSSGTSGTRSYAFPSPGTTFFTPS